MIAYKYRNFALTQAFCYHAKSYGRGFTPINMPSVDRIPTADENDISMEQSDKLVPHDSRERNYALAKLDIDRCLLQITLSIDGDPRVATELESMMRCTVSDKQNR